MPEGNSVLFADSGTRLKSAPHRERSRTPAAPAAYTWRSMRNALTLGRRSILLALAAAAAGCGGDGRTPLVVYSPHGRDLLTVVEQAYEEARPEVDVRWLDMGSQEVYDRIRSERANPQADVWFGGPATILARGAAEGLLAPSRPSWADALDAADRRPDGLYYTLYQTPTLIVYNRDAIRADEAPADWDDLLDERWHDEVVIRDPLASGTMRTIFGKILADSVVETGSTEAGFDWLRRLDGQTREYVHSPAVLHEKLTRQEGLLTLWEMTDTLSLIDRGAPIAYRFPESGTAVIQDSVGVVAGSERLDEAAAFVDWLGSPEALALAVREAFRLPARGDLDTGALAPWVADVQARLRRADVDWQMIEENGAEWMAEWDRSVRGQGGG